MFAAETLETLRRAPVDPASSSSSEGRSRALSDSVSHRNVGIARAAIHSFGRSGSKGLIPASHLILSGRECRDLTEVLMSAFFLNFPGPDG